MMAQLGTAGIADGRAVSKPLSQAAIDHAARRGISAATLATLGAKSGMAFFPGRLNARSEAIFFPYTIGGEVVNSKGAAFPEKDFIGRKGGELCFFNLDRVLAGPMDTVFIVEGEWDAAALVEAELPINAVLSVPNGAREHVDDAKYGDDERPRGFAYVDDALRRGLHRCKRFVWCGDNDAAGHDLRVDMVRLLGAARFHFVDWPEGTKDANDYLLSDGPEALYDLVINGSLPWPVAGLYRISELPEPAAMSTWDPGFPEWENKVRLAPGTLSIVTGHPGHGKTQIWAQIWFQVCQQYDQVAAIASFETRAKPHHRRAMRTLHSGKLERDMTDEEKRRADQWINDHFLWLLHPEQKPTLDWFLDMAEVAVVRHGARIVQLDPWNRIETTRPDRESETDYIGRCLSALYQFAQDLNCHVQILAHPAKMTDSRRGSAPYLEDISGSKHWDNRADQGFTVHRPKLFEKGVRKTEAQLFHRKARFEELGYPCRLALNFNLATGRYVSTDYTTATGQPA